MPLENSFIQIVSSAIIVVKNLMEVILSKKEKCGIQIAIELCRRKRNYSPKSKDIQRRKKKRARVLMSRKRLENHKNTNLKRSSKIILGLDKAIYCLKIPSGPKIK